MMLAAKAGEVWMTAEHLVGALVRFQLSITGVFALSWQSANLNEPIRVCQSLGVLVMG